MPSTRTLEEILCFVWIPGMMFDWVTLPHPDPRRSVSAMRRRAAAGRRRREEVVREVESSGSDLINLVEKINLELSLPREERVGQTELPWWKRFTHEATWTWPDARAVIGEVLGAPAPVWDERSHSWWQEREAQLDWVRTPADVAHIQVPDWKNSAPVARMLEARERWNEAFPENPVGLDPPIYPAFLDLGMFVIGTTRFFTILGGEPELATALMDKCMELSASYAEFTRTLSPASDRPPDLIGFGGDACCLLSPTLYERYGIGFDLRLLEYIRNTFRVPDDYPCNLHSCGPSEHLYESWGRHPNREDVTVMQTRLLPGTVGKLRRCLPETLLELTFHPQHFDFAEKSPEEVERVVWESAREAGFDKVSFTVIVSAHEAADIPKIETNLRVCYDAVNEMNCRLEAGSLP